MTSVVCPYARSCHTDIKNTYATPATFACLPLKKAPDVNIGSTALVPVVTEDVGAFAPVTVAVVAKTCVVVDSVRVTSPVATGVAGTDTNIPSLLYDGHGDVTVTCN